MENLFKHNEHKLNEMPSEAVWLRLQERVESVPKKEEVKIPRKNFVIRHLWVSISAAAVVLLLLGGSMFFISNSKQPPIALLDELSVPRLDIENDIVYNMLQIKLLKQRKDMKLDEGSLEQKMRPNYR